MKFSLGAILAIWLSGLQFVAVLSVVSFNYISSERVLLDHATALISEVGQSSKEYSRGFLEPAVRATNLAKRLIENNLVSNSDPIELEKLLFQQMQVVPQFSGMYYGDEQGNFVYVMRSEIHAEFRTKIVHRDEDTISTELIWRDKNYKIVKYEIDKTDRFDPRGRPWYRGVKSERSFIWTAPYIFFSSQRPGITAATPVISSNDQLKGAIGVDIEIDEISGFLSNLEIGQTGVAMALSSDRNVIAHPKSDLIKVNGSSGALEFVNIDEIEDLVARKAFGNLPNLNDVGSKQEIESEFIYNDGKFASILIPGHIHDLPWSIAIYAPLSDFIGGIEENRTRNIWIAIFIALTTGLIGLKIANKINQPIRDFAARAGLLASGKLTRSEIKLETYPELEEASETLANEIAQRKTFERVYGHTFALASRGMAQISPKDGRFIRVNSQLAEILGFSMEEMVEMSISDILHAEDADTYTSFQNIMNNGYEYNQEKRYVRKNGDVIWLQVNAILIRDQLGKPMYAVATMDDKTEQKTAESKISDLSRDLSHFARVNMMGQMAEGLAHELNQPLTSITQNVDAALLTVKEQTKPDPELVDILQDMDRQAHHGAEIIRALRGLVRKDEGQQASFSITELLEQTLQLLNPEAREHGVAISFVATKNPNVFGNRVQIAQVIMNLTRNAIEAVDVVDLDVREISIETARAGNFIEVHVIDTGPGIDPEVDLFAQFESSKKDGMGLGLSLSRTLIEANNGTIWYEPKENGRSKFCFTIPIASLN
jgi:PAS domain S-box-containing protein